jgi:hypothetical protein
LICIIIKLFWGMSISRHFFHELFTSLAKKNPHTTIWCMEKIAIYTTLHTPKKISKGLPYLYGVKL